MILLDRGHDDRQRANLDQPILAIAWHPSVHPATVPWRPRTRNVLTRLGIINNRDALLALSPRQLLSTDHVGPVTLRDFKATVEAQMQATVDGRTVTRQEVLDDVAELRRDFPIDQMPVTTQGSTPALRARPLATRSTGGGRPRSLPAAALYEAVKAARRELERIKAQDPQEALREIARAILRSSHTDAIVRRLGWDGGCGCTQREAAALAGVSQRRIDQLEHKLRERVAGRVWLLPDAAEAYIGETEKNLGR